MTFLQYGNNTRSCGFCVAQSHVAQMIGVIVHVVIGVVCTNYGIVYITLGSWKKFKNGRTSCCSLQILKTTQIIRCINNCSISYNFFELLACCVVKIINFFAGVAGVKIISNGKLRWL